jgi:TRAP-type C4-dicarboxylate transport system substrate-binding protein
MGKYVQGATESKGLYLFPKSWEGNFNNTFNNVRPIAAPADLKGLRIRVQPGPVLVALFKALGANPVSISFNQVYTSLQTKLIDGMVTGTSYVESSKLYEVLKYASTTNHVFSALATIANIGALQRLPKNLHDLVDRHFYEGAVLARNDSHKLDDAVLQKLKTQGMAVNSCSIPQFRDEVRKAGLYAQWKSTYGAEAWAILEKGVGTTLA